MASVGKHVRNGEYEVTFVMDEAALRDLADHFGYRDGFHKECIDAAEEIDAREFDRLYPTGPGLSIILVDKRTGKEIRV